MADDVKKSQVPDVQPVENSAPVAEEEGTIDERELPFPRATIVNMMRQYIDKGKQIKGQVKDEMNIWLGGVVKNIAEKMNAHPYSYVDYGMFKEAVRTYEQLEEIEKERERMIKYLERMKADIEMLEREIDKKFRV